MYAITGNTLFKSFFRKNFHVPETILLLLFTVIFSFRMHRQIIKMICRFLESSKLFLLFQGCIFVIIRTHKIIMSDSLIFKKTKVNDLTIQVSDSYIITAFV